MLSLISGCHGELGHMIRVTKREFSLHKFVDQPEGTSSYIPLLLCISWGLPAGYILNNSYRKQLFRGFQQITAVQQQLLLMVCGEDIDTDLPQLEQ